MQSRLSASSKQPEAQVSSSQAAGQHLTMYDLPSEFPQEPGLPDVYHDLQPELLSATLQLTQYGFQERFPGTDINLYYDPDHPLWHKRPDWFVALGTPYLYSGIDMRLSYVVWDEGVAPSIIVELLSPGTEKQDLGPYYRTTDDIDPAAAETAEIDDFLAQPRRRPPAKWKVYEDILQVPYYIVYSRYTNQLHFFQLQAGQYREQPLAEENPRIWLADLEIGLGLWEGEYKGVTRPWLRWQNAQGDWIPTEAEAQAQRANLEAQRANSEAQRADAAEERLARLLAQLQQQGLDPTDFMEP